jgi:hypothetical protein
MEGVIAVLALFGVPGIYFFGKTDIGQAIVERIRHGTAGGNDPTLLAEVDELRARLAEVEERLDFAERQLTAGPDARRTTHDAPR